MTSSAISADMQHAGSIFSHLPAHPSARQRHRNQGGAKPHALQTSDPALTCCSCCCVGCVKGGSLHPGHRLGVHHVGHLLHAGPLHLLLLLHAPALLLALLPEEQEQHKDR